MEFTTIKRERIAQKLGTLGGLLNVCETDISSLKAAAIVLNETASSLTGWSDPAIVTFRARLLDLTEMTSEAIATLEIIERRMELENAHSSA